MIFLRNLLVIFFLIRATKTERRKELLVPDDGGMMIRVAYESHFKLVQHYSAIIFQARVAITTVMVLAIGFGLQVLPLGDSAAIELVGIPARGLAVYAAAMLVNLLHAMEVSYLIRFYQIVRGGRELERKHDARSYFSAYDQPESWPLHVAYAAGIFVLVNIFIGASWASPRTYTRAILLIVTAFAPLVLYGFSVLRLRANVRSLLHSPM